MHNKIQKFASLLLHLSTGKGKEEYWKISPREHVTLIRNQLDHLFLLLDRPYTDGLGIEIRNACLLIGYYLICLLDNFKMFSHRETGTIQISKVKGQVRIILKCPLCGFENTKVGTKVWCPHCQIYWDITLQEEGK